MTWERWRGLKPPPTPNPKNVLAHVGEGGTGWGGVSEMRAKCVHLSLFSISQPPGWPTSRHPLPLRPSSFLLPPLLISHFRGMLPSPYPPQGTSPTICHTDVRRRSKLRERNFCWTCKQIGGALSYLVGSITNTGRWNLAKAMATTPTPHSCFLKDASNTCHKAGSYCLECLEHEHRRDRTEITASKPKIWRANPRLRHMDKFCGD